MTKTALSASIVLALTALSTLALAQSVTPRPSATGIKAANVTAAPRVSLVKRMKITTPAARAADLSRRGLLVNAKRSTPAGTTKSQYIKLMDAVWGQDLDANGDGVLSWQSGPESLGPQVGACVVVKYKKQDAKKEKDPAKPGQWIETPETWVPEDWLTWAEVLGTTSYDGKCEVIGVETAWRCMTPDGNQPLPEPQSSGLNIPKAMCHNAYGFPVECGSADPKAQCEARGGSYQSYTKLNGCEKMQHYGPDSREAFLKVAEMAFNAEDHNGNGVIEAGEGQYLCYH